MVQLPGGGDAAAAARRRGGAPGGARVGAVVAARRHSQCQTRGRHRRPTATRARVQQVEVRSD